MTQIDLIKEFMRDPIVVERELLTPEQVENLTLANRNIPIVGLFKTVIDGVQSNDLGNATIAKQLQTFKPTL
jgi:hypothetical protein